MIDIYEITIPALSGDKPRRAYVYLPERWRNEPERRYPVLYMFDGHNVFFDSHATYGKSWGLGEFLDFENVPLIVAAVECNHDPDFARIVEYAPYPFCDRQMGQIASRGKETMDWLVEVFKPWVDAHYPTLPGREATFIGGSSMGGLMSLYAVTAYNHVFSRAAALSPSVEFGKGELEELIKTAPIAPDTVVYMDFGERELGWHRSILRRLRTVADLLLRRHVLLTFRMVPGGEHSEACWEQQIPFFLSTLLYGWED